MRATHPGDNTILFDLVTQGERMSIYVPSAGTLYEGEIEGGRSPFGESYGIEPWDMVSILLIGRRLIEGEFRTKKGFWKLTLRPTEEGALGDGLRRVDLDRKTRLPVRAYWEREGSRWEVIYRRWETTASETAGGREWLMPSRFVIIHRRPRVRVEVMAREGTRQFRINPQLDPRTFELSPRAGSDRRPLYELGEALQAQ